MKRSLTAKLKPWLAQPMNLTDNIFAMIEFDAVLNLVINISLQMDNWKKLVTKFMKSACSCAEKTSSFSKGEKPSKSVSYPSLLTGASIFEV